MLDDLSTYQARTTAVIRQHVRIEDEKGGLWILKKVCIPKYLELCINSATSGNPSPAISLLCTWADLTGRYEHHQVVRC